MGRVLLLTLMICFMNCPPVQGHQGMEETRDRDNGLHGQLNPNGVRAEVKRRDESGVINPNVGGPKRDEYYRPSIGYEPYWEGGDWVLPVYVPPGSACGKVCSPVYIQYGVVCGWNSEYHHQTFPNYCELKNADCDGTKGWFAAYRGECQPEIPTYPTKANDIVSRASYWVENFSSKPNFSERPLPTTSTTPPTTTKKLITRTKLYRPNFGYEPYWPGGDWVLLGDASGTTPKETTPAPPMVCGIECHYMYQPIREVCGRLVSNIDVENDKPGSRPDNYTVGYETFPTYCEFLDKQCTLHRKTKGNDAYVFVRNGSCEANQDTYFKPFYSLLDTQDREKEYTNKHAEYFKEQKVYCLYDRTIVDKNICKQFDSTIDEKYKEK